MQASIRIRNVLAALFIVVVATALIGATALTPPRDTPVAPPAAKLGAQAPVAGTFTGEFDDGVPVFRLPSIAVTTSRSAELARMAREEQVAMKQQARRM